MVVVVLYSLRFGISAGGETQRFAAKSTFPVPSHLHEKPELRRKRDLLHFHLLALCFTRLATKAPVARVVAANAGNPVVEVTAHVYDDDELSNSDRGRKIYSAVNTNFSTARF